MWSSPAEFFAMGGHGFYVWGSYAVLALLIIIELVVLRRRSQKVRATLARQVYRESRGSESQEESRT